MKEGRKKRGKGGRREGDVAQEEGRKGRKESKEWREGRYPKCCLEADFGEDVVLSSPSFIRYTSPPTVGEGIKCCREQGKKNARGVRCIDEAAYMHHVPLPTPTHLHTHTYIYTYTYMYTHTLHIYIFVQ